MKLHATPITLARANNFVAAVHRHHGPSVGHKFSIGCADEDDVLRGVVIAGRPVARGNDDGVTCEVTRLATDGAPNACSFLYGCAARAAKAMGYTRIITYTLATEPGGSLRAAGWVETHRVVGRSWDTPSRPRMDNHPTTDKICWRAP